MALFGGGLLFMPARVSDSCIGPFALHHNGSIPLAEKVDQTIPFRFSNFDGRITIYDTEQAPCVQ